MCVILLCLSLDDVEQRTIVSTLLSLEHGKYSILTVPETYPWAVISKTSHETEIILFELLTHDQFQSLLMQIGAGALVSFRLLDYQKTWVLDLKVSCLESGQTFAKYNLPEVEELSLYIILVWLDINLSEQISASFIKSYHCQLRNNFHQHTSEGVVSDDH